MEEHWHSVLPVSYTHLDVYKRQVSIDFKTKVCIPDTLVYGFDAKKKVYIIYNWKTHHYMIGNKHLIFIIDFFKTAHTISDAIDYLTKSEPNVYILEDLTILFLKMYQRGYLTDSKKKEV